VTRHLTPEFTQLLQTSHFLERKKNGTQHRHGSAPLEKRMRTCRQNWG